MSVVAEKQCLAKPFLKWAGGKSQLLHEIEIRLPEKLKTGEIDTYIEAFVGGGAVFFYIAQRYDKLKHFYLFDINQDLVNCYKTVKKDVESLIHELKLLQDKFLSLGTTERKEFYLNIRKEFNSDRSPAKLIFLNKTCYNGLYRVNRKGEFNVPFGDYENPTICDEGNLLGVSELLQKAEIVCDDFEKSAEYINKKTFVYLDPPYRPLSPTASFTSYSKEDFDEKSQVRLAQFCKRVDSKGAKFLLSNSAPKDSFFKRHYEGFNIAKVKATRAINCKASGRGRINELLITNYQFTGKTING